MADLAEPGAAGGSRHAQPQVLEPPGAQVRRCRQLQRRRDRRGLDRRRRGLDAADDAAHRPVRRHRQRRVRQPAERQAGLVRRSAGLSEIGGRRAEPRRPDREIPLPPRPRPLSASRRPELGDRRREADGLHAVSDGAPTTTGPVRAGPAVEDPQSALPGSGPAPCVSPPASSPSQRPTTLRASSSPVLACEENSCAPAFGNSCASVLRTAASVRAPCSATICPTWSAGSGRDARWRRRRRACRGRNPSADGANPSPEPGP